ncbi:MAG: ROK family protein [Clostridia bacterium]|nr:ROK family protein [Clostridia bacterium]
MYTIGVDLGGTNIAAGIVSSDMKIIKKGSVPTLPKRGGDAVMADMAALCKSLVSEAGLTFDEIESVGIASPGTILYKEGMVERSDNLGFYRFPIADKLRALLPGVTVYLENDANAAAWAEAVCGAARGTRDSVMITLGTGLGGGIVLGRKIYAGHNGAAAELGHVLVKKGGRLCNCGRRGCFEAYCSATGLIESTMDMMEECRRLKKDTLMTEETERFGKVNGRVAFNAAKRGDVYAQRVVDEYKEFLADGIIDLINIFQPEVLSIGGGICNEGDYLLSKDFLEKIDREQFTRDADHKTVIRIAELGNDAGIIGAAMLGAAAE